MNGKAKDYEIIQGDCLEAMASIEDSSVDAIVTDPPYCSGGLTEAGKTAAKGQGLRSENLGKGGWFVGDNMTTAGLVWLLRSIAVAGIRVVKPSGSILVFCDWRMLHTLVPAIESVGLRYQGLIVWNKRHFALGTGFRPQHELVMHFTCGKPEYHDKATGNVIEDSRITSTNKEHFTQKPTELLRQLINVVCPPESVVLDPFCGSGSTGVAALEIGRRFIGIERDAIHVATAERRLEAASQRSTLFTPVPLQIGHFEDVEPSNANICPIPLQDSHLFGGTTSIFCEVGRSSWMKPSLISGFT